MFGAQALQGFLLLFVLTGTLLQLFTQLANLGLRGLQIGLFLSQLLRLLIQLRLQNVELAFQFGVALFFQFLAEAGLTLIQLG